MACASAFALSRASAGRLRGLAELVLALLLRLALQRQQLAVPSRGSLGGAGLGLCRRRRRAIGAGQQALVRVPAHLSQPEAADDRDLLGAGDAKTRQGERMRQPTPIQVDEHAHLELVHCNRAGHGARSPTSCRDDCRCARTPWISGARGAT
jgi:hypothetical protein